MATSRGAMLQPHRADYSHAHQLGSQEAPIDLTDPHPKDQQGYQDVQPQYLSAAHCVVSDPSTTYLSDQQHNGIYVTSNRPPAMVHTRAPPQQSHDVQLLTSDLQPMCWNYQPLCEAYPTDCPLLEATYTSAPQSQTANHKRYDPSFTVQLGQAQSALPVPAPPHFLCPPMLQFQSLPLVNPRNQHTTPMYQTSAAVGLESHYKAGSPKRYHSGNRGPSAEHYEAHRVHLERSYSAQPKPLDASHELRQRAFTKPKPAEPSIPRKRKFTKELSSSPVQSCPSERTLQPDCEDPSSQDNSPSLGSASEHQSEHYAKFTASEWKVGDVAFFNDPFLDSNLCTSTADAGSSVHMKVQVKPKTIRTSVSHTDDFLASDKSSGSHAICPKDAQPKASCGKSESNFSSLEDHHEHSKDRLLRPEQERLVTSMMNFTDAGNVGPTPHYMYEHLRQLVQECDEITVRQVVSWNKERIARTRIVDSPAEG